jgi:hypothetical protein
MMSKLFAVATMVALGSLSAMAGEMTGYLSDEKCAASSAKAKTAAEWINPAAFEGCAQKCVKAGSPVVFVTEDNKILKIDPASKEKVTSLIGHKVTVTGNVDGGTLKIDTIASVKM